MIIYLISNPILEYCNRAVIQCRQRNKRQCLMAVVCIEMKSQPSIKKYIEGVIIQCIMQTGFCDCKILKS